MKRRSGPHTIGERYLLQFPGGVERIAEVAHRAADGAPELRPLPFEEALPGAVLPGGEWLLGSDERVIRDWAGAYWSVTGVPAGAGPPQPGELPYVCAIEFCRYSPPGVLLCYRTPSMEWPEHLSDQRLGALLRRAWETLDTDQGERRRRSDARRSLISDL
jgi:hypothetical protein